MAIEIERRFLVTGDDWRADASPGRLHRQAYLARTRLGTIRVRLDADGASLTVKSHRRGRVRDEFECELPLADAAYILKRLCITPPLEKIRHSVRHEGRTWHIDVYRGGAQGLVIAEIELAHPDEEFVRPPWLGREVTHVAAYRNSTLARQAPQAGQERARAEAQGTTGDDPGITPIA